MCERELEIWECTQSESAWKRSPNLPRLYSSIFSSDVGAPNKSEFMSFTGVSWLKYVSSSPGLWSGTRAPHLASKRQDTPSLSPSRSLFLLSVSVSPLLPLGSHSAISFSSLLACQLWWMRWWGDTGQRESSPSCRWLCLNLPLFKGTCLWAWIYSVCARETQWRLYTYTHT